MNTERFIYAVLPRSSKKDDNVMKMDKLDLFDEMESEEGDQGLLEEIEQRRKEAKKNFSSIINKKKLNKYELDDIMA